MSHCLHLITLEQVLKKFDSFEINIVQGLLHIYCAKQ